MNEHSVNVLLGRLDVILMVMWSPDQTDGFPLGSSVSSNSNANIRVNENDMYKHHNSFCNRCHGPINHGLPTTRYR